MDKIQEITSKLYTEGIEKGKEEADKIIAEAKAMRDQIVEEAKKEAEQIITSAKKETDEWKSNTQSELKLFASQAVEALKSEITNLVTDKLSASNVKAAVEDKMVEERNIKNWCGKFRRIEEIHFRKRQKPPR